MIKISMALNLSDILFLCNLPWKNQSLLKCTLVTFSSPSSLFEMKIKIFLERKGSESVEKTGRISKTPRSYKER